MFTVTDRALEALQGSLEDHPRSDQGCYRVIPRFDGQPALVVQQHEPGDATFKAAGEVVLALAAELRSEYRDQTLDLTTPGGWVLTDRSDHE